MITVEEIAINKNAWEKDFAHRVGLNMESIAGYGSSFNCVKLLIDALPKIFAEFGVSSIVDIPCGDYFWMNFVQKNNIKYIGCDLVDEQIAFNKEKYPDVDFRQLNMIVDEIPKADLIFSRDCLIHLSFKHIDAFLKNCRASGAKYLMTSTYPTIEKNEELNGVIGWRFLNMQLAPFNFPKPMKIVDEGYHKDPKCMAVWNIQDIS